mmetsp:Transcript_10297/g.23805  ORF Transcript_10297/g.23805 Transcript_10297/m.23805 type:complete len:102 (+) Transcript_10297:581-886(+)
MANPSPQIEQRGYPPGGIGGNQEEEDGAGDRVGTCGVEDGEGVHPQGAAKLGRIGQKCGFTKPSCPANSKFPHVTGNCPGIFKMTLGNVTTIPSPHTKQGG